MKFFRWQRFLPVIGISLLIYLIAKAGIRDIFHSLASVNYFYLIPAILVPLPYLLIQTTKWNYLLLKQGISLNFIYLIRLYLIGLFYGILTPGRLGTLVRIAYIKERTGGSYAASSGSVILERIADIIALFILALLGTSSIKGLSFSLFYSLIIFFILVLLGTLLLMNKTLIEKVTRVISLHLIPEKYKGKSRQVFNSFYSQLPTSKALLLPVLLAILGWGVIYSGGFYVAKSLNIDIPWISFIGALSIGTIVGLIPITISGWGTREATLIILFSQFGIKSESVIALSLLSFLLLSAIPALIGAFFSFKIGTVHEQNPIRKEASKIQG